MQKINRTVFFSLLFVLSISTMGQINNSKCIVSPDGRVSIYFGKLHVVVKNNYQKKNLCGEIFDDFRKNIFPFLDNQIKIIINIEEINHVVTFSSGINTIKLSVVLTDKYGKGLSRYYDDLSEKSARGKYDDQMERFHRVMNGLKNQIIRDKDVINNRGGGSNPIVDEEISTHEKVQTNDNQKDKLDLNIQKDNAMIKLINIDNKVDPLEIRCFDSIHGFSRKGKSLENPGPTNDMAIEYLSFKEKPEEAIDLLVKLIKLSKSDHKIQPSEYLFIKMIAKEFGILEKDIDLLINE